MAIGVQPVDGLIHRLLQQNAKPSPAPERQSVEVKSQSDQVNISPKAHIALSEQADASQQKRPGEKALESHLLNLYRSNDKHGG